MNLDLRLHRWVGPVPKDCIQETGKISSPDADPVKVSDVDLSRHDKKPDAWQRRHGFFDEGAEEAKEQVQ